MENVNISGAKKTIIKAIQEAELLITPHTWRIACDLHRRQVFRVLKFHAKIYYTFREDETGEINCIELVISYNTPVFNDLY